MRTRRVDPDRQKGAVAIITALVLVVLVGFAGLALDGGHLYLTKTELQNSADACALAAAYELTGSPIASESFSRAEDAGKTVGAQNDVDFQGVGIDPDTIEVTFGTSLSGGSWLAAGAAPPGTSKYVRCTITRDGITPWFMQVLGFGDQTVMAMATATLAPSQQNCAIPMGLCTNTGSTAPDFGYVKGDWYSLNFEESGGTTENLTGSFRWIDFDPSSTTPGCSGGGAQELACLFEGAGQCTLPPNGPATCSSAGNSSPTPGCVGQSGNVQSLGKAFNTRFGICQGGGGCTNDELRSAPPDFTGFSYTMATWSLGRDAMSGTSGGAKNFTDARGDRLPVQPSEKPNGTSGASADQMATYGADRRLVTVPFVECENFASGQHAPIRGYACGLLLHPYKKVGSAVQVTVEYLGASNEAGSPCATSGSVGSAASAGPLVPALVQ